LAPTVGIAATGFCYPGRILQLFHRRYQQFFSISSKINKFYGCRQQKQSDRFNRIYHQHQLSSTSAIIYIVKIFKASSSRIVEFVQIDGSRDKLRKSIYSRQAMRRVTIKLGYASRKKKSQTKSTKRKTQAAGGVGVTDQVSRRYRMQVHLLRVFTSEAKVFWACTSPDRIQAPKGKKIMGFAGSN
jgi:hypothetical protein